MAFHMDGRHSEDFYRGDVLSDILASGNSSRLVDQLVKERELFTEVNAYITGDIDPGLFIVMGKPRAGITLSDAQSYLEEQLSIMRDKSISERELTKVLNKTEANFTYGQTSILNKAMNLGYFELFDQAGRINQELDHYKKLRPVDIQKFAQSVLDFNKVSVLHYIAENNG